MKEIIYLYRQSLKKAKQIDNQNFKQFAIRKLKEDYRTQGTIQDAKQGLDILNRYSIISKLYWFDYYTRVKK